MKKLLHGIYLVVLALWVGGGVLFTFYVTPVIFASYPRDTAGDIVGNLMPGFLLLNLLLAAVALVLFLLYAGARKRMASKAAVLILLLTVAVNAYMFFRLYPRITRAGEAVASFETTPRNSPERKEFSRLHGISATLNLLVLICGTVLLVISPPPERKRL